MWGGDAAEGAIELRLLVNIEAWKVMGEVSTFVVGVRAALRMYAS